MCDYSIINVASRPAKVGDKLQVRSFGRGTSGFAPQSQCDMPTEDLVAVCVLPGTELAFDEVPLVSDLSIRPKLKHKVARFRQVNKDQPRMHHDCLEFPDGTLVLLTMLSCGQKATVLQLPAAPKNAAEEKAQERLAVVG